MKYLIQASVFLLMISIGMGLNFGEVTANWRRFRWTDWIRLLLATFILPPALALLLANIFRFSGPETIGLFMIGAAPGAPLLTRNLAKRGFDMHRAASYQVWSAMMVPVMIPLVVFAAGKFYSRTLWISPISLIDEIVLKQFLPLAIGALVAKFSPRIATRLQPAMNIFGNLFLVLIVVLVALKIGPLLKSINPLVPLACLLLAVGSVAAARFMVALDPVAKQTFGICNANRHVGLALLISGDMLHVQNAFYMIACYALVAPIIIIAYAKIYLRRESEKAAGALP
jgi:BASS family bile acid:Na+ symporter